LTPNANKPEAQAREQEFPRLRFGLVALRPGCEIPSDQLLDLAPVVEQVQGSSGVIGQRSGRLDAEHVIQRRQDVGTVAQRRFSTAGPAVAALKA